MAYPKTIGDGTFTIGEKIGNGAFDEVFFAKNKRNENIAIKFEKQNAKKKILLKEIEVS